MPAEPEPRPIAVTLLWVDAFGNVCGDALTRADSHIRWRGLPLSFSSEGFQLNQHFTAPAAYGVISGSSTNFDVTERREIREAQRVTGARTGSEEHNLLSFSVKFWRALDLASCNVALIDEGRASLLDDAIALLDASRVARVVFEQLAYYLYHGDQNVRDGDRIIVRNNGDHDSVAYAREGSTVAELRVVTRECSRYCIAPIVASLLAIL